MKLKGKITLPTFGLFLLAVAGIVGYIGFDQTKVLTQKTQEYSVELAGREAERFALLLDKAAFELHSQAAAFQVLATGDGTADREQAGTIVRLLLANDNLFLGTWVAFEPDAFDGQDARFAGISPYTAEGAFASYWVRSDSGVSTTSLEGYRDDEWYTAAFDTGRPAVLEPYEYEVDGQQVLMTTVSYPIIRDGETIGATGIDMSLDGLQQLIATVTPLDVGYAFLVSGSGTVIAHPNSEFLNQEAISIFHDPEAASQAFASGTVYQEVDVETSRGLSLVTSVPMELGETGATWNMVVAVPQSVINRDIRRLISISVIIGIVAMVVILASLVFIVNSIVRPIAHTTHMIAEIADGAGDLTQRLTVSTRDEVGDLATGFNRFVEAQNTFVSELVKTTESVNEVKNEVVAASEETTSSIQEIGANIESIGKQFDALDANVNESVSAIEEVSANISSIDQIIVDQSAMVEETTSAVNEISASLASTAKISLNKREAAQKLRDAVNDSQKNMQESYEAVQEVAKKLSAIQSMNAVINSIAAQTNLLSMNAAIEAAHAGDSGRGFAVVAEEIRKLAEQASGSSSDINAAVQDITGSIERSSSTTEAIAAQFEEILQETESSVEAFVEISSSIDEMSAGSEQIIKAAQSLNEISATVRTSSGEIKTAVEGVVRSEESLHEISESTKRGLVEIRTGIKQIVQASSELVDLSGSLDTIVSELHDKTGRFIIE